MNSPLPKIIELKEYQTVVFLEDQIPESVGKILWNNYRDKIDIIPPLKIEEGGRWEFTSKGWIGHIPLPDEYVVVLTPKVPLSNLFRMLEYAYRLKSFQFLPGLVDCDSIQEFYERLANILSRKVLDRSRKGFYRCYESQNEILPYVRGKLDINRILRKPWAVNIRCHYEEHTADIEDNQLLSWTLFKIARSGMCTERVLPTVRMAYRTLQGFATLKPHLPKACMT